MFRGSVDINLQGLFDQVAASLEDWVGDVIKRVTQRARKRAPDLVAEALRTTRHYEALGNGGLLAGHFGLADGNVARESVLSSVQAALRVEALGPGDGALGGVQVLVFRSDFQDALSSSLASYASTKAVVPWLEWLLMAGPKVIVGSHWFYNTQEGIGRSKHPGRSGQGFMAPVGGKRSVGWAVPPSFNSSAPAGNWLEEAADLAGPKIQKMLEAIAREEVRSTIPG